jgi:hypothetical protein
MAKKTGAKKKGSAEAQIAEPLRRATAAQRKEWARAEKEILRLREGGAALFDELWETVHEVMEAGLYLGGGMRSESQFIAKMLPGEDRRSVARNTLVAIAFTPRDEAEKGLTFLEEVAKYVQELSGSREMPRAIDLDRLRVPVRRADGDLLRKVARDCTREEIIAARNALGKKKRREAHPLEAVLAKAPRKRKALASVKVRTSKTHASFTGVPFPELPHLGAALAKIELPD